MLVSEVGFLGLGHAGDHICNSQLFISDPEYVRKPSLTPPILFGSSVKCRRWKVKAISKSCCSHRYRFLVMTVTWKTSRLTR